MDPAVSGLAWLPRIEAGVTTGFCAKASLTGYVWEMLGNAMPASF